MAADALAPYFARSSAAMTLTGGGGGGGVTTARCDRPACSQVLPVKPQGVWARGVAASKMLAAREPPASYGLDGVLDRLAFC